MNTIEQLTSLPENRRADRRAALLAASALLIFGGFLGCMIYRLLGIGESELYDNLIERYFVALFYKCATPTDVLRVVLASFLHESFVFIAVFIGGFTLFTIPVSVAALLYRGMLFGFSLTMLQFSSKSGLLFDSLCYLFCEAAIATLLAILAAAAFAHFYRDRKPTLRGAYTRRYTALFCKICALIFTNVCGMLFLIYVYI